MSEFDDLPVSGWGDDDGPSGEHRRPSIVDVLTSIAMVLGVLALVIFLVGVTRPVEHKNVFCNISISLGT
ncbi:MAG: hypothetical protein ACYDGR_16920 [Candidatus Dormibacteria bacterium]